jgi:hypothetical protein
VGCATLRVALLLLFGWSAYFPAHVLATDLEMIGGLTSGGNYIRSECPKGSYLVGLKGRRGGWVDRIASVCAPWLPAEQTFGRTAVGPFVGTSEGGKETSTVCWESGVRNRAVQSVRYRYTFFKEENRLVLSDIHGHCTSLSPSADTGWLMFGPRWLPYEPGPYEGGAPNQACPAGEIAVGIHGRAERFVYFIGLICGPPPSLGAIPTQVNPLARKPVPPATKVNPLATAPATTIATRVNPLTAAPVPSADMFTITTPVWNASVLQGQLVVKATNPKIGMTQVSELKFEWLDAPPDWCKKPPYPCPSYVNQFPIDTSPLLQGYQVPAPVTRGNTGRWEVSVRASGKAVPGPWSFPVRFHLFLTQPTQSQKQSSPIQQISPLPSSSVTPPSPIQQTAPLPSPSVMQAPAPSSAPAQMNRSPFMVRPRGVEENGAKEGNRTVDPPAELDKKP